MSTPRPTRQHERDTPTPMTFPKTPVAPSNHSSDMTAGSESMTPRTFDFRNFRRQLGDEYDPDIAGKLDALLKDMTPSAGVDPGSHSRGFSQVRSDADFSDVKQRLDAALRSETTGFSPTPIRRRSGLSPRAAGLNQATPGGRGGADGGNGVGEPGGYTDYSVTTALESTSGFGELLPRGDFWDEEPELEDSDGGFEEEEEAQLEVQQLTLEVALLERNGGSGGELDSLRKRLEAAKRRLQPE
mmetsp:Transcript_13335/g.33818  ORF Transcript_13335/g.33818 Transcript_13335/m.33818 type:complete len:243 (+) Transcript_13335:942-1670(+)